MTAKLALIATATAAAAIALSAAAQADDAADVDFLSPTGNINCSITLLAPFEANGQQYAGNNVVNCEIVDHTWSTPDECGTTRGHVAQVSMRADATKAPIVTCAKYPNQLPLPWPTLDYGQSRTVGVITCTSEVSGITCTNNSTGHFFRLSNESFDVG